VLTILKVAAGITAAMFVTWAGLYPSSGKQGMISPRFAAIAAILVGVFLLSFVLWVYLHP
jgi:hypothetical protein